MQDLKICYTILKNIYIEKAYLALELSKHIDEAENKAFVTNLVYGVVEKNTEFDYYISKLTQKKPKNTISILLKMGMYCIKYLDSIPNYAAVSKIVDLCALVGKQEVKGFVNAVLKKFISDEIKLPDDEIENLSIKYSIPKFIVKKIIDQYGLDLFLKMANLDKFDFEHIRVNLRKFSKKELIDILNKNNLEYIDSIDNAIYAKFDKTIKDLYSIGKITIQSLTSMKCCEILNVNKNDKILDLCSAPGGKSIYLSEIEDVMITSCDIHEHRLSLIQSYINRMSAKNIEIIKNDATKLNENFVNSFDKVLCDVPCSGLGVFNKKPDIFLNMDENAFENLSKIQYKILDNAKNYVKKNGILLYSTCTIIKEENENLIKKFLKNNKNFKILEEKQYLPETLGQDGFYICKMEKMS